MKLRITRPRALLLSGLLWLFVGALLLYKGLSYFIRSVNGEHALLGGTLLSTLLLLLASLLMGFLKGHFFLRKSAVRTLERLASLPDRLPLTSLYTKGYLLLIAGMMGLGFLFKRLPLPLDVKGFVDVAIGFALINGASFYMRGIKKT